MTNEEFSNSLDTLLNSYNIQASFGEGSNNQGGIALDEYEKSVFLTQAQDAIVKSYFDRTLNQQGQGFDDSARRQIDFSSLISVKKYANRYIDTDNFTVTNFNPSDSSDSNWEDEILVHDNDKCYDQRGILVNLEPNILFMLNEKLIVEDKTYIVVPINYNEYDREMSKAYGQPLKKQAWRLFSNNSTGYDIQSEIIPIGGIVGEFGGPTKYFKASGNIYIPASSDSHDKVKIVTSLKDLPNPTIKNDDTIYEVMMQRPTKDVTYIIRYVRRPTPIILTDLPNNLSIDGVSKEQECELNPILHMDILNKAFELAITTRGGGTMQRQQQESNQRQRQ